jgi:hypothetical protein
MYQVFRMGENISGKSMNNLEENEGIRIGLIRKMFRKRRNTLYILLSKAVFFAIGGMDGKKNFTQSMSFLTLRVFKVEMAKKSKTDSK